MAEYWKSTPKYWCKHCSTYVKDTKFERTQHEATGKHQGNLKRFLRGVHQDHEREEREKSRAKAEVDRLKGLVAGPATSSPKPTPTVPLKPRSVAPPPQASAAERKKQMAQLVEMGVAVPDQFRGEMALAGEWQTVSERRIDEAQQKSEAALSTGVRKRKAEDEEEEENNDTGEAQATRRGWGSTTKRYPGSAIPLSDDLEGLLAGRRISKMESDSNDLVQLAQLDDATKIETGDTGNAFEGIDDKAAVRKDISAIEQGQSDPTTSGGEGQMLEFTFKKRRPKAARQG